MAKIEKILLYIPIIGFLLMLTMLNSKNMEYSNVKYDDIKTPIWIQVISLVSLFIMVLIG